MVRRTWGPDVCLDCRDAPSDFCEVCTLARRANGLRTDLTAWNAYKREYDARARKHPVQGPKIREGTRMRVKKHRERNKKPKEED